MRLLIVKLSALGDLLHTVPALTTLRRHLPQARLDWLVEAPGADLLADHPAIHELRVVPRRRQPSGPSRPGGFGRLAAWIRFVREFRSTRYDLVIDFQGLAKSALWTALARSPRKAGFGPGLPRNEGAWLALNERVTPPSPEVHALDRGLYLLEALGFPRLPLAYDLPVLPAAEAEADRLLAEAAIPSGTPFAAINPMTRWPTKNWETTRFAEVADCLAAAGLPVVFTGASADRAPIEAIVGRMRRPAARLDGRTRLPTLASVFRRARVVLSTDTGPMHLAAAVNTPVVALFGPTAPWRTGPYGEGHVVLRTGLDCSPCYKRACLTTRYEPHACLLRLDPGRVAEAVLRRAAWPAQAAP